MREAKTKEINGKSVTVQPWPARHAWRRQITLGKVFGPSLKTLGSALDTKNGGADADVDLGSIGGAFAALFTSVTEDKADEVLELCLNGVRINNVEVTINTLDAQVDDMVDIYKIVAFVLEVNYGSFLGANGIGKLLASK